MSGSLIARRRCTAGTRTPPRVTAPADGSRIYRNASSERRRGHSALAPLAARAQPQSYAFTWQGTSVCVRRHLVRLSQPEVDARFGKPLEHSGASHWVRMPGDNTTLVGAFRLRGERGRILAAVEAARTHFGSDFIGAFELGCDSLSKRLVGSCRWQTAPSSSTACSTTCRPLRRPIGALSIPGREFGVQVAPDGISRHDAVREATLDEFLDLADLVLRRNAPRRIPSLLAVITFVTSLPELLPQCN